MDNYNWVLLLLLSNIWGRDPVARDQKVINYGHTAMLHSVLELKTIIISIPMALLKYRDTMQSLENLRLITILMCSEFMDQVLDS